jgi:hypothetical protein
MHGSFSRADTNNFMAAIGPDFKSEFIDPAPVSNADIGRTIAQILGLKITNHGRLLGRPLTEAMPNGRVPGVTSHMRRSAPAANGLRTILIYQQVGSVRYLDAAGFPERTIGLSEGKSARAGMDRRSR